MTEILADQIATPPDIGCGCAACEEESTEEGPEEKTCGARNSADIETLRKKCRITRACATCRQRRKKCDGGYPCGPCVGHNRKCLYTPAKRRGPAPRTTPQVAPITIDESEPHIAHDPLSFEDTFRICTKSNPGRRLNAGYSGDCSAETAAPPVDRDITYRCKGKAAHLKISKSPQLQLSDNTSQSAHNPSELKRRDLLREANELSEKMTLVVSLDEHGNLVHLNNMGYARGLHLYRNWTQTFRSSDGLVYMPDPGCCQPFAIEQSIQHSLRPNAALVGVLSKFYWNTIHPYVPFLSSSKVSENLFSNSPSYSLYYSFLAVSARLFERRFNIGLSNGVYISQVLTMRAKKQILHMVSSPTPCLITIQSLLLLEMADRESVLGSPWLISGMAIRMALDLGLNLGVPDTFKEKHLISVPVWTKTWIYCCIVDSLNSFLTGRSHMIHESDCVQDLEECLNTTENQKQYRQEDLLEPDHFFVWLFKLFEITGKISRTITSIRIRRNLPYSLPDLHALLSNYRKQLPKKLVYNFDRPSQNSQYAAHLNLLYLSSVIFLYRTIFACNLLVNSPLRPEYLRILEYSVHAILTIYSAHGANIHLAPLPIGHPFDLTFTVCVILVSEDARNKSKVVRILKECLHLLEGLATQCPSLRRLCALGKELLESITNIPLSNGGPEYDRALLVAHFERTKQVEYVYTTWQNIGVDHEHAECERAFQAFLNVELPASTRPEERGSTSVELEYCNYSAEQPFASIQVPQESSYSTLAQNNNIFGTTSGHQQANAIASQNFDLALDPLGYSYMSYAFDPLPLSPDDNMLQLEIPKPYVNAQREASDFHVQNDSPTFFGTPGSSQCQTPRFASTLSAPIGRMPSVSELENHSSGFRSIAVLNTPENVSVHGIMDLPMFPADLLTNDYAMAPPATESIHKACNPAAAEVLSPGIPVLNQSFG